MDENLKSFLGRSILHNLKAQGKFIFSFSCTYFFTYFWHLKITNWAFKKSPGLHHFKLLGQGKKILFLDTFYFVFF